MGAPNFWNFNFTPEEDNKIIMRLSHNLKIKVPRTVAFMICTAQAAGWNLEYEGVPHKVGQEVPILL